jgi:hypothetical protein
VHLVERDFDLIAPGESRVNPIYMFATVHRRAEVADGFDTQEPHPKQLSVLTGFYHNLSMMPKPHRLRVSLTAFDGKLKADIAC